MEGRMTVREQAHKVVVKGNSCQDCAAGVCRFCVVLTNDIEAAIRAAGDPLRLSLLEALALLAEAKGCFWSCVEADECEEKITEFRTKAEGVLGEWEAK